MQWKRKTRTFFSQLNAALGEIFTSRIGTRSIERSENMSSENAKTLDESMRRLCYIFNYFGN